MGTKNLAPHRDSIPGPSSPVASRYTHCAIPTERIEVYIHSFLASAHDGDEWLTSRSGGFTLGKRPDTHRTRGWVDSRSGAEFWSTEKISFLAGNRTSDCSSRRLFPIPLMIFYILLNALLSGTKTNSQILLKIPSRLCKS